MHLKKLARFEPRRKDCAPMRNPNGPTVPLCNQRAYSKAPERRSLCIRTVLALAITRMWTSGATWEEAFGHAPENGPRSSADP